MRRQLLGDGSFVLTQHLGFSRVLEPCHGMAKAAKARAKARAARHQSFRSLALRRFSTALVKVCFFFTKGSD